MLVRGRIGVTRRHYAGNQFLSFRCDRKRRFTSQESRSVRHLFRREIILVSAREAGRMSHRIAASEGSCRRSDFEDHDSRGAGLSRMSASTASSITPVERQEMSVDIAGVGFGPAMGGFLTTLSRRLLNEDGAPRFESTVAPGMPLQVICYERADGLGFGVSGAVTRARGIRASFPGIDLSQIPMAVPVKREKLVYLLDPIGASRRSVVFRVTDRL